MDCSGKHMQLHPGIVCVIPHLMKNRSRAGQKGQSRGKGRAAIVKRRQKKKSKDDHRGALMTAEENSNEQKKRRMWTQMKLKLLKLVDTLYLIFSIFFKQNVTSSTHQICNHI